MNAQPTLRWSVRDRDRVRRLAGVAALVASTAAVAALLPAAPVSAVNAQHSTVVSADPANWTPHALDGAVYRIIQIGNRVYMGGSFTRVRNANNSTALNLPRLVAFNATTGQIDTGFQPNVNGTVRALAAAEDGQSIYVGGSFTSVNGGTAQRVARLNAATGVKVAGFSTPSISAVVNDMRLVGNRLILGGSFQSVGGVTRRALTALNATTGAADASINLGIDGPRSTPTATAPVKVEAMDVTPNGSRLVIIGNFSVVAGQPRHQVAVINLNTTPATLSSWSTLRYQTPCANGTPSYVRGIDISPDGSWFSIVTAGFTFSGRLCDTATRWDFGVDGPNKQPTWINYTGGDSLLSVAITGAAVYVGGHQRWMDNTSRSGQSPGSVSREGIAALNPTTGRALSWNPGKERGVGTGELYATPVGLWVGSDTSTTAGEFHGKIAFFPLP